MCSLWPQVKATLTGSHESHRMDSLLGSCFGFGHREVLLLKPHRFSESYNCLGKNLQDHQVLPTINLIPPNPVPRCHHSTPLPCHLCPSHPSAVPFLLIHLHPSPPPSSAHPGPSPAPLQPSLSFPQSCVHSTAHTDTHASLWSLDAELSLRKKLPTRDAFLL